MAVNCFVKPRAMFGVVGVIVMERSDGGGVTVSVVVPDFPPEAAVMVVTPVQIEVANPLLLIVATDVDDELHVTAPVRSCVELSV